MSALIEPSKEQLQFESVMRKLNTPGLYYMALSSDSVLKEVALGFENIATETKINAQSYFALFSITKTFTATAIFQLQEVDKLHIDDLAETYLPQYPFLSQITIRHLLAHQSGLNNPLPIKWIHLESEDSNFNYREWSNQTLKKYAKQKWTAGEKTAYSNLNYLLLGEIIEKVSGVSYSNYMEQPILSQASEITFDWPEQNCAEGYHQTGFQSFLLGLILDRSKYTNKKKNGYISFKRTRINGLPYGGLNANANGLKTYIQELLKPNSKLLSDSSKTLMFTEANLVSGKKSGHSLGWFTGKTNGHNYVCHAGGGGGYYTELRIYPKLGKASFVLTNSSGFSDKRILDKMDDGILY
jgi:D-alanyl-D-alanine carboxypeptidase